ncbi:hypothetical protein [Flavobacterium sp. AJR]|jgi:hypothetical protein|uniref:hypothetical protein n=2 Tax=Flavobacterium TaxID=237 RepID=UPI00057CA650|nr:hypothetical protein [Flavobacterium sp. AJR]KIC00581.1 hypothetical protein OA88_18590 [Flavobacterium sp. JRM]OUL61586.1 hypothetical protein B8T70_14445 [Flavobacterium sp. AJR]
MKTIKNMKNLYVIILLGIITGCSSKIDENQIIGKYEIDKFVIRDSLVKVKEYRLLLLNPDKTFELKNYDKKENSKGTWKAEKTMNDDGIIIAFSFLNRKIEGKLNGSGNIITFNYPNDLYLGKYSHLLYVKLNK